MVTGELVVERLTPMSEYIWFRYNQWLTALVTVARVRFVKISKFILLTYYLMAKCLLYVCGWELTSFGNLFLKKRKRKKAVNPLMEDRGFQLSTGKWLIS